MTRSAQSNETRASRRSVRSAPGCLIVVTATEQSALDLLLTAARRRLPDSTFEFPKRITTRRNGHTDAELAVTRNLFREMEGDGGFIVTWQVDGHRFGLPDSINRLLLQGNSTVVAAPADVVAELQEACPDVRMVRLTGQLDAARAPLTPRACLRRIVGPRLAQRLEARGMAPTTHSVSHTGDMASAVRALTAALVAIAQDTAPRGRRITVSGRQPRASRCRRPASTPAAP